MSNKVSAKLKMHIALCWQVCRWDRDKTHAHVKQPACAHQVMRRRRRAREDQKKNHAFFSFIYSNGMINCVSAIGMRCVSASALMNKQKENQLNSDALRNNIVVCVLFAKHLSSLDVISTGGIMWSNNSNKALCVRYTFNLVEVHRERDAARLDCCVLWCYYKYVCFRWCKHNARADPHWQICIFIILYLLSRCPFLFDFFSIHRCLLCRCIQINFKKKKKMWMCVWLIVRITCALLCYLDPICLRVLRFGACRLQLIQKKECLSFTAFFRSYASLGLGDRWQLPKQQ